MKLYGICRQSGVCECGLCEAINLEDERLGPKPPLKVAKEPTPFVWTIYYEPPETRNWRITFADVVDGRQRLEIEVVMECWKQRHARSLNRCQVCGERHALPLPSDQRYAYRWYPMKPSIKSIAQWHRRRAERLLDSFAP